MNNKILSLTEEFCPITCWFRRKIILSTTNNLNNKISELIRVINYYFFVDIKFPFLRNKTFHSYQSIHDSVQSYLLWLSPEVVLMTVKFKLFQCIQKFCHTMGIFPSQPNSKRSFRWKTLLYLLPPIIFLVPLVIFLLTIADSMQEYGLSVFMITSVCVSISNILGTIWCMPNILEVIEKFEQIIEKSKYKTGACIEWRTDWWH